MIKFVCLAFYIVFLLNIGSYAVVRSKWNGRAELIIKSRPKKGGTMTYCLPGLKSSPFAAFKFLENTRLHQRDIVPGGITYVRYSNWGFDPQKIATQIVSDIKKYDYTPYIISISVGDQIARYVEQLCPEVTIIAINPLPNCECLKYDIQITTHLKVFLINFCLAFLGWFGQIRSVKTDVKRKQSLSLYADMLNCVSRSTLTVGEQATRAVIFSYFDEYLQNSDVRDIFYMVPDSEIAVVDTLHANTAVGGNLYRDKIIKLLRKIY